MLPGIPGCLGTCVPAELSNICCVVVRGMTSVHLRRSPISHNLFIYVDREPLRNTFPCGCIFFDKKT